MTTSLPAIWSTIFSPSKQGYLRILRSPGANILSSISFSKCERCINKKVLYAQSDASELDAWGLKGHKEVIRNTGIRLYMQYKWPKKEYKFTRQYDNHFFSDTSLKNVTAVNTNDVHKNIFIPSIWVIKHLYQLKWLYKFIYTFTPF